MQRYVYHSRIQEIGGCMQQDSLEVTYIRTADLVPYRNNAKKHTDRQVEQIANSIERFGFADTVGVWHNESGEAEIVFGHGSVLAAKLLGIDEVPCVVLDRLTDEERRAYCHIHNTLTLGTGMDEDILLADMAQLDMDWSDYGMEALECEVESASVEQDEVPEDAEERVRRGQVWVLARTGSCAATARMRQTWIRCSGGGAPRSLSSRTRRTASR